MMNAEVKEKWLDALRSGEYKQGKYQLKSADGCFCCLGVLCDIAAKEGVIEPAEMSKEYSISFWEKEHH